MKVIVTIPAYNEEKTIGQLIEKIKKVMISTRYPFEILVVDDGSKDRTAEISKKFGAIVYSHPYNYGLAETFRTEIEKCLGRDAEIIVHIDADAQYDPAEIPKLIKPIINKEADLVLGSRFAGTIEEMPIIKKLGNKAFSRIISQITRVKITDAQTGFRAFTKQFAEKVKITSKYTYTQEMIIRAVRQKFKIKEIPIYFAKRKSGKSRLLSNPFSYAIRAWINIIRIYRDYEPLRFFGMLGSAMIFASIAISIYILNVFLHKGALGTYQKIPTLLVVLLLFVTGFQIIIFGFLADMLQNKQN